MFRTIKAAKSAGFRELRKGEYGGEQITLKGQLLARDPKAALSATAWGEKGCRVRDDAEPHATLTGHVGGAAGGKTRSWHVYRDDQVLPKAQRKHSPAKTVDLLAALWAANRSAKRWRNAARGQYNKRAHQFASSSKRRKESLYALKAQALHHLVTDGVLQHAGYHRFLDGNYAELLSGGGYTFHRPCPHPTDGAIVEDRADIDAKPRQSREVRLKDAEHTLTSYLSGRLRVGVYEWPPRPRDEYPRRHVDDIGDAGGRDDDDRGDEDDI
ncbi:MAG: hypothetical protein IT379_39650 [Deltaproteobacteria bacterium]|nr:hypothetical protein [Deltaproteobacteria bacterium]